MNCSCSIYQKSIIKHILDQGFYYYKNNNIQIIKNIDQINDVDLIVLFSYPIPIKTFQEFLQYFVHLDKSILFMYFIGCTPLNFSFKGIQKNILKKCFYMNFKNLFVEFSKKSKAVLMGSKAFETLFSISIDQLYNSTYFKFSFYLPLIQKRVFIYDDLFLLYLNSEKAKDYKEFFIKKLKIIDYYIREKMYNENEKIQNIEYEVITKFPKIIYEKPIALDIETNSLDFKKGKIITLQYAISSNKAYIIDFENFEDNDKIKDFLKYNKFITHNGTFDSQFLLNYFQLEKPINIIYDTLYGEYILNPLQSKYGLKFLVYFYTTKGGYEIIETIDEEEFDIRNKIKTIPKDVLYKYGAYDACLTYEIYEKTFQLLKKNKNNLYSYYLIYNKFLNKIPTIQNYGIKLDINYYLNFSKKLIQYYLHLEDKIYSIIGEKINLRSLKQLDEAFKKLYPNIDFIKSEKSKRISFNKEALKLYESKYKLDLAILLNEMNKVSFLMSHLSILDLFKILKLNDIKQSYIQYIDYLFDEKLIHKYKTGLLTAYDNEFVYPNNVLYHTVSGRMSSASSLRGRVNFLALPKYKDYRQIFTSRFENGYLIEIDYESMEVYLLALTVGKGTLYDALKNNLDIHSLFGYKVWNILKKDTITYEEFYKKAKIEKSIEHSEIRGLCKNITFTAQYGGGANAIASSVGLDLETSKKLLEEYYNVYPEVKKYVYKILNSIEPKVQSILKRELYLPYCKYNMRDNTKSYLRTLINFPIQSAASNLTTLAFLNMKLKKSLQLLAIHDSILFDINPETEKEDLSLIQYYMEDYVNYIIKKLTNLDLKLKISIKKEKGFYSDDMKNIIKEELWI